VRWGRGYLKNQWDPAFRAERHGGSGLDEQIANADVAGGCEGAASYAIRHQKGRGGGSPLEKI
jgi:hypothetical protein